MTTGAIGRSPDGRSLFTVDRYSPVPLYFQLATQIEAAIRQGDLQPGSHLEGEIELADRLGVSRPTLRRAIEELVDKGLLVRKRGIGTQIVQPRIERKVDLTSLYDDLVKTAHEPTTSVTNHATVPADTEVAVALAVPKGTPVVLLERLRSSDGEPLAIMRNWLPSDVAPFTTADLEQRGLYELLRGSGVLPSVATQRVGAKSATAAESKLLKVREGAPLVTVERRTSDEYGRVFEYAKHVYNAAKYSVEVTIVSR
jgi:DNA-binding GntR family transcriptional regulator